jgi:sulfate/thiosulfate transport system substrate-binding protein
MKPTALRVVTLPGLLVAVLLVAVGCGGASDEPSSSAQSTGSADGGPTVSLVAYSTPEVVYDELIADFARTPDGNGVQFKESYGASGEQSRAVAAGLKADVVAFSLAPDVDRLVDEGLVAEDWEQLHGDGFVSTSLVSFVVRKGNPKNVRGWDDLLRPGVEVVTPNPFTSGGAKWNLLGAYAHGGLDYISKLITEHVRVQPKSAREALQAFTGGQGDVLISYENEAILAQKKGQDVDYVTPQDTFLIQNPIAVTKTASATAKTFVEYALSRQGQEKFAKWGYRPVDRSVLKANASSFPEPKKVTTIDDVGGWQKVDDSLFDPDNGSVAKIEEQAGVSTAR